MISNFHHIKDSKCGFCCEFAIAASVAIWKNCSNAEIALHIVAKIRFGPLENLFDAVVLSWIIHILNPCTLY